MENNQSNNETIDLGSPKLVHQDWFTEDELIDMKEAINFYIHSTLGYNLDETQTFNLAKRALEYDQVLQKLREERRANTQKEFPILSQVELNNPIEIVEANRTD